MFIQENAFQCVICKIASISSRPQLRCDDLEAIFVTHLIIIIKLEIATFHIDVIFFRGWVSEIVMLS